MAPINKKTRQLAGFFIDPSWLRLSESRVKSG
jgi:hypothetical protein